MVRVIWIQLIILLNVSKKSSQLHWCIVGAFIFFAFVLALVNPGFGAVDFKRDDNPLAQNVSFKEEEHKYVVKHLKTPDPLKAIYMTSCVVGTPSLRDGLVKLVDDTEINAIVIDVKDFSGTLSFKPENPDLLHAWEASKCGTKDMKEFLQTLKDKNIYTIARVTVFQDPHFTKLHPELAVQSASTKSPWKDRKGLSFLDVGGKATWDYVISIAKESYDIGFDEINFDYIRYPSDGNMKDTVFTLSSGTKSDQLEKFFSYLHEKTKEIGVVTSADLFGMTTTNTDDLNIGQVLEKALPYFDYVAPMVYPSHYPNGFNNWKNPNDHVYDLIHFVMKSGGDRAVATSTVIWTIGSEKMASTTPQLFTKESYPRSKLRTWIQDFDYGGNYDVAEVKAQIQASNDVGVTSWMIWSPSNRYTAGALLKE